MSAELVRRDAGETTIEYACVTLHVGEVVWRRLGREAKREVLGVGDVAELGPGEAVSIVTDERVTLPAFVTGHIFPKGRLGAISLMCQPTTIDPGYDQCLLVHVTNVGAVSVRLPRGLEIAKMELTRLSAPVERPYASKENPKTHYRRDDYVFAGESLVKDPLRLEHMEERLTDLERGGHRIRRMTAVLLLCALGEAVMLLRQPVIEWVRGLPETQARGLFISVVGGVLLTGALSAFRRVYHGRRSLGEWLAMIFLPEPADSKDKPLK